MSNLCTKCGLPGEFRKGHRQCLACEKANNLVYSARPEVRAKAAAYREIHREKYRKQNVDILRRRKTERHAAIAKLKSVPCKDCGSTFPPYAMDFDHRDSVGKVAEISYLLNKTSAPWARILEEVQKCDVVCVNCHRRRTWIPPGKPLDNRRKLLISLKDGPCKDCGGIFHYCQMDFDHVSGEKVREVSLLKNKASILVEAAKCEVVCANCHRERSHRNKKGQEKLYPSAETMLWRRSSKGPQTTLVREMRVRPPVSRPWHSLAGTVPDVILSEQFNISKASVCMYRKKMGIPTHRDQMKMESRHA